MRYIKKFEMLSSRTDGTWEKMDRVQEKLTDIAHILEDEGFGIEVFAVSESILNINLISIERYKIIQNSMTPTFAGNLPDLTSVTELPEVKEYVERIVGILEDNNFGGSCLIYLSKNKHSYSKYSLFNIIGNGKCQLYGSDLKLIESLQEDKKVQNIIVSEINCIRHIIEDSGFNIWVNSSENGNFIGISTSKLGDIGLNKDRDITDNQDIEEFDDRLKEICSNNNYVCKNPLNNGKTTRKSGYIVWHCWNPKKINPGLNYE